MFVMIHDDSKPTAVSGVDSYHMGHIFASYWLTAPKTRQRIRSILLVKGQKVFPFFHDFQHASAQSYSFMIICRYCSYTFYRHLILPSFFKTWIFIGNFLFPSLLVTVHQDVLDRFGIDGFLMTFAGDKPTGPTSKASAVPLTCWEFLKFMDVMHLDCFFFLFCLAKRGDLCVGLYWEHFEPLV